LLGDMSCELFYAPGLYAHVVVQKSADSISLHRQEKVLKRSGVPLNQSSLKDLFYRCAELLKPIYDRVNNFVSISECVKADETYLTNVLIRIKAD